MQEPSTTVSLAPARRRWWRAGGLAGAVLALVLLTVPGCAMFFMMTGKGQQKALFEFPEKARVLIMVDTHPNTGIPVDVPAMLGTALAAQWQPRANHPLEFVDPGRLTQLQYNADAFRSLSIADVARKTHADYVVYVDLLQFSVQGRSENQISQAVTQTMVRVVDRDGQRVFPTDASAGMPVSAALPPTLGESASSSQQKDKLIDLLSIRITRMFFDYDLEDQAVIR